MGRLLTAFNDLLFTALGHSGGMTISAIASATTGIASAVERFNASASRTAAAPLDNLAGELVERITAETGLRANAAVLRTADEMTGQLLDMLV